MLNSRSFESRNLDCNIDPDLSMEERAGTYYNCSMLPLFDLGSLHHDFYLLNIRSSYPFTSYSLGISGFPLLT